MAYGVNKVRQQENQITTQTQQQVDNVSVAKNTTIDFKSAQSKTEVKENMKGLSVEKTGDTSSNQMPKPLITMAEMKELKWADKKPPEQLRILIDKYLSQNDENFDAQSKKEKNKQIDAFLEDLTKLNGKNSSKLTAIDIIELTQTVNILHDKKLNLEEYKTLDEQQRATMQRDYDLAGLQMAKALIDNNVEPNTWHVYSGEEKLEKFAELLLTETDPDFVKLSSEEKKLYTKEKTNELLKQYFPNIDKKLEPAKKDKVINDFFKTSEIALAQEPPLTIKEFMSLPLKVSTDLKIDYNKSKGYPITENDIKLVSLINKWQEVNPGKDPSSSDLDLFLKKLSKDDPELAKEYKSLANGFDFFRKTGRPRTFNANHGRLLEMPEQAQQAKIGQLAIEIKDTKTKKDQFKLLSDAYAMTGGNAKLVKDLDTQLAQIGIDSKIINKAKKENYFEDDLIFNGIINNDSTGIIEGSKLAKANNNEESVVIVAENLSLWTSGETKTAVSVDYLNNHSANVVSALGKGINLYESEPVNYSRELLSRDDVTNDGNKAVFTKSLVETSPTPERQQSYATELSKLNNAAVTEGLAAASKSVDESVRAQYVSTVQEAAKNLPPEAQESIKKAIETGKISQETLAKANNNDISKSKDNQDKVLNKDTDKNTKGLDDKNATKDTTGAPSAGANSAAATKDTNVRAENQSAQVQAVQNNKVSSQEFLKNSELKFSDSIKNSVSESATISASSASAKASDDVKIIPDETQNLQKMRDEVAQNAKQTSENIEKSIEEREVQKAIEKVADDLLEELSATDQITVSEKEQLKQKIKSAGSISRVYEIISSMGGKDIFIERLLTRGSTYAINSFIKTISDNLLLQEMYLKAYTDSVKKEILKKLPEDSVHSLLAAKKINNLDDVNPRHIYSYLMKNLSFISQDDLRIYGQHLDKFDYERLLEQWNASHGIEKDTLTVPEVVENKPEQAPPEIANNFTNKPKPMFDNGEMSKTLADGTTVKRAQTFGAISNVVDDNAFETVQDNTQKAMNDTVLTPGSDAWRQKYGKYEPKTPPTAFTMEAIQEKTPKTAFTMADMDGDAELTSGYPPQKVSAWKLAKGKGFKA